MCNVLNFAQNNTQETIDIKSLNKIRKSPEYQQNQMQIDCIKRVLIENADVPEILLNWLIDSVKSNTSLELKTLYKIS